MCACACVCLHACLLACFRLAPPWQEEALSYLLFRASRWRTLSASRWSARSRGRCNNAAAGQKHLLEHAGASGQPTSAHVARAPASERPASRLGATTREGPQLLPALRAPRFERLPNERTAGGCAGTSPVASRDRPAGRPPIWGPSAAGPNGC